MNQNYFELFGLEARFDLDAEPPFFTR